MTVGQHPLGFEHYDHASLTADELKASVPVPWTRDQAIKHIRRYFYFSRRARTNPADCQALSDFLMRCRAVLTPRQTIRYINGSTGLVLAMNDLLTMDFDETIAERKQTNEQVKELQQAADLLCDSAGLIGVPPRLLMKAISSQIEGETIQHRERLDAFLKVTRGVYPDRRQACLAIDHWRYDSTRPAVKARAVRKLWACFPQELRTPATDWQPYACGVGLMKYCGITTTVENFRMTAKVNFRKK